MSSTPPDPAPLPQAAGNSYEAWVARLIPPARTVSQLGAAFRTLGEAAAASSFIFPQQDEDGWVFRLPGPRGETGDPCGDGPCPRKQ